MRIVKTNCVQIEFRVIREQGWLLLQHSVTAPQSVDRWLGKQRVTHTLATVAMCRRGGGHADTRDHMMNLEKLLSEEAGTEGHSV